MMDEPIETCRKLREISVEEIREAEGRDFPTAEAKAAFIKKRQENIAEMDRLIAEYEGR